MVGCPCIKRKEISMKLITEFIYRSHDNGFIERKARVIRISEDGKEEIIDGPLNIKEAEAFTRAYQRLKKEKKG
jgi:malate/lactate dehydrogenase